MFQQVAVMRYSCLWECFSKLLWWGTGVCGNVSANCSCTKSLYLLLSLRTFSTTKARSSIERTTVSENTIKQLHTLPVLHSNRCLTTEHSQTTAHCNGNFDTENQMYVPQAKCTVTFRTHCICFVTSNSKMVASCSLFVSSLRFHRSSTSWSRG
jgi:hypothetical protein